MALALTLLIPTLAQAASCVNLCGGWGDGCWCDDYCETANDCCADKTFECGTADPAGDTCADPVVVNALPFEITDNISRDLDDLHYGFDACPGDRSSAAGFGGKDHVYSFEPTVDAEYTLTLSPGPDFDPDLYLVLDCGDIDSSCLRAEANPGAGNSELVQSYFLKAGEPVFVVIDSQLGAVSGGYHLKIECEPNACGGCGPAPLEADDGLDNDCDGEIDEDPFEMSALRETVKLDIFRICKPPAVVGDPPLCGYKTLGRRNDRIDAMTNHVAVINRNWYVTGLAFKPEQHPLVIDVATSLGH